ncbi:hypothetical protein PAMC26577_25470 [Caballeronia sordidicola]|uniref:Uncharacterized protein n=1 Tax=Caballeronia sordidicola TaxID=196367 RepID=A0A242MJ00_CABSO|nr:hypothetical protein PAMC26577_25470 [Caballeronia sordidicola]
MVVHPASTMNTAAKREFVIVASREEGTCYDKLPAASIDAD